MKDINCELSHQVIFSRNLLRHLQHIHILITGQAHTDTDRHRFSSLSQTHTERFACKL